MIPRSKKKPTADKTGTTTPLPQGEGSCVLSAGTHLEGDLNSKDQLRLDGSLKGALRCEQRLVIGANGKVEGQVNAAEAVILGTIIGNIKVGGSLHLKGTAKINGDISAKYLTVEEGASYNGQCKIG